uniref:Uncharacterized protein n=1 Tax=Glossina pallidipes TaxID=7398 RepID=A0A1A9Z0D2_GLOPL
MTIKVTPPRKRRLVSYFLFLLLNCWVLPSKKHVYTCQYRNCSHILHNSRHPFNLTDHLATSAYSPGTLNIAGQSSLFSIIQYKDWHGKREGQQMKQLGTRIKFEPRRGLHFLFHLNPTAVRVTSIINKMQVHSNPYRSSANVDTLYGLMIRIIYRIKKKTESITICLERSIAVYNFGRIAVSEVRASGLFVDDGSKKKEGLKTVLRQSLEKSQNSQTPHK